MSDMLEKIYGTEGSEALEKAAQARFIEKLASEYDVDVSDLDADQLEMLEAAVIEDLEDQGHLEKEAGEYEEIEAEDGTIEEYDEEEELQKTAAAYDAMGRVMAHGFMEELEKNAEADDEDEEIYVDDEGNEYSAAEVAEMEKEALPAWLGKLTGAASRAGKGALKAGKKAGKSLKDAATAKEFRRGQALRGDSVKGSMNYGRGTKAMKRGALRTGGLYGGSLAALGGGGAMLGKKKKSSALDALANERAEEILGLFGQEKYAADEELDDAITIHAFEKLAEAGYPVEEMIEALQDAE